MTHDDKYPKGIASNMIDFAFDPDTGEGAHSALTKLERWRNCLEEMNEIANPLQRKSIDRILNAVNWAIRIIVGKDLLNDASQSNTTSGRPTNDTADN